jgi:hypothetical protein
MWLIKNLGSYNFSSDVDFPLYDCRGASFIFKSCHWSCGCCNCVLFCKFTSTYLFVLQEISFEKIENSCDFRILISQICSQLILLLWFWILGYATSWFSFFSVLFSVDFHLF